MKFEKALLALFAACGMALSGVPANAVVLGKSVTPPAARFPVHLVSGTVENGEVTLQYYTPKPGEQFCVAYTGVRVDIGAAWQHRPQCVTSDSYGAATIYFSARGRGTLIVSIILPEGQTHTDTLQLSDSDTQLAQ